MLRVSFVSTARPSMKPYDHKIVLDRIKRLLAARAQQVGS